MDRKIRKKSYLSNVFFPLSNQSAELKIKEKTRSFYPGTEKILFVDDEKSIMKMSKSMLEKAGYHVTGFTNPIEALEKFNLNFDAFDLVITDMTMPQMTGAILAKKLMAIRKDIPVIICTGHNSQIDGEKAKATGISALIMKPTLLNELTGTIRKVLDNKILKAKVI
jgi:CheY-like chemotaxis protein